MDIYKVIDELKDNYPFCECIYGDPKMIPFSDKIFTICQTDCVRYGKSWACPPHAGSIEDNIKRVGAYEHFFIFTTVWDVEDAWNAELCLEVKKEHEAVTRQFREELFSALALDLKEVSEMEHPPVYILSAGCTICDECACPLEPCRHPTERLMTMESHGIVIIQLMEELGITLSFGSNSVVYSTMILF